VYSRLKLASKYLHYYLTAFNGKGHGMHSPFVFDFILQVLNNRSHYQPPVELEERRRDLLRDTRILDVDDYGAGSVHGTVRKRTVREIARTALKQRKYAQVLYRIARHYQPVQILELGTSLGLTTAYLSAGAPEAKVISVEGSKAIAAIARETLQKTGFGQTAVLEGNFDEVLPSVLNQMKSVDLVFVDGNHRYEPTVSYFRQLLLKVHEGSIIIFDDIHWSAEMEAAWEHIKENDQVKCAVDLFFIGIVFFKQIFREKQNFTIRF
jgi:predicted O-methyltransferase YrrM